jgi:colanic acid/amylovoran biosynthesis protein
MMPALGPELALFGAPLDTGNLGVSALGLATIGELSRRSPTAMLTVFDSGAGVRPASLLVGDMQVPVLRRGAWISRRIYRGESLWTMRAASRVAPNLNANVRALRSASAVLDISGGDSFADTYGKKQRDLVVLPKRVALACGTPLVLLPQTFGPFATSRSARRAADIVAASAQAWARDPDSYERLVELLGERYDEGRHRQGADVAFGLVARRPRGSLGQTDAWLADGVPLIGMNISGLLSRPKDSGGEPFGLRFEYLPTMVAAARRLLDVSDARLLLVPHVVGEGPETDVVACRRLEAMLERPDRVTMLPAGLGADETKHVIGRLAWFVGSRMHATIAALSSRTPAAAVAYSDKFHGVFADCGVRDRVLDARSLTAPDMVDAVEEAWRRRQDDQGRLNTQVPAVEQTVKEQFDSIMQEVALPASADPM